MSPAIVKCVPASDVMPIDLSTSANAQAGAQNGEQGGDEKLECKRGTKRGGGVERGVKIQGWL